MGIVASKADHNTPLLNLCRERKELIRAARDARYHLAKSHLLYFQSLLDFTNTLNQFVHEDLAVIPFSSDDDSSSELVCSGSDSESDSDSNSHCLACNESQAVPSSKDDDQNPQKPSSGDEACGSSNDVHEGMEKPSEGLGFVEKVFVTDPVDVEKRVLETNPSTDQQNSFHSHDLLGLYDFLDNTELVYTEPEESDVLRVIREREGIPDLEPDSDHNSLVRKTKRKKNVQESSSTAKDAGEVDKRDMRISDEESSSTANVVGEVDKSNVEASTCNGQAEGEADETRTQEKETSPESATEVTRSDEELSDEAYESCSCSSSSSSCSGSGHTDIRNVVEKINSVSKRAASNSEVSELLEVSKVVHHQPLGSQFKELASRVLGSSKNSTRALLLRRDLPQESLAVSLSMTLEKLYAWEKKLHAEVTAEEKLRVSYEKGYSFLKSLDQDGAEANEIYEAEAEVKLRLSKVYVSVRAVESVSMRVHKIRDEELSFQVNKMINMFKEMWRFLAKCHHKQFQLITRSKSCVHLVERGSRRVTQKVEEQIRRFRESLRGYIDAHRGFVGLLNEWLNRNIMEEDEQTKTDAPEIFRVCGDWLREIVNVDEVKVLSAVEEMELRFRSLGFKQVEEQKQRLRTERLCKELETKTKEVEESWGTQAEEVMGPELLSLRESATHEREKHEGVIREINDAVSMSLQECLVHIFEALEDFCFGNFKAYQSIRIGLTETETQS